MRHTQATSLSGHLFVPMLCLCLGFAQAATAGSDKTTQIWKRMDEFTVLGPQDAVAGDAVPLNDQPVAIEPAELAAALAKLQVNEGKGAQITVPLFEKDAARRLAAPLSTALSRAAADQDILFAIDMSQKAALFGSKPVSVAGRAFYQNQHLHLIIGELHVSTVPSEYKNYPIGYPKIDRRLHPHQTGGRSQEAHYDSAAHFETGDNVSLFEHNGKVRSDWLVLNVAALAGPDQPAAPAPRMAPAVTSQSPPAANAGAANPSTSASPSIEERLLRLKHLREQDLITDEEYNRKRNAILDQL